MSLPFREALLRMRAPCAVALCLLLSACGGDAIETPAIDAVLKGRLFDARNGTVIDDGVVTVAGERIVCAGAVADCDWPQDTPVHDHGDAMLLPGLIDLHVHARPHYIGAFVPAGVTTVRDAGNALEMLERLRSAEGAPRIIASGPPIDGPESVLGRHHDAQTPLQERGVLLVEDAVQARAAVAALVAAGSDWIKLYEQLPPDAFEAAVDAAHAAGKPVMVDLGMAMTRGLGGAHVDLREAGHAGVASIEHSSGAALAYQRQGGDPLSDAPDAAVLSQWVAELARGDVAVVPTLASSRQFSRPGSLSPQDLPGAATMRGHFEGHWQWLSGIADNDRVRAGADADLRLSTALLPLLREAGIMIGAGSDLPAAPYLLPGAALHQELQALVDAGLTATEALQAATSTAAAILRNPDIGVLEAGRRADIVVVRGDPLRNIGATRDIASVWFDGKPLDLDARWRSVRQTLDAAAAEADAEAAAG